MTEKLDQEQIKLLEAASTIKRTKFLPAHFNNKRNARYLNHHYMASGKSIHSMEQRNIYLIKFFRTFYTANLSFSGYISGKFHILLRYPSVAMLKVCFPVTYDSLSHPALPGQPTRLSFYM